MNNISIVGRLTKDIEVITTTSKTKLARFIVAVPSEFKDEKNERKTDFFPCVAWRDAAENLAKFFKKGYPIGLIGSMNQRSYTVDGKAQSIWELNVKSFSFVGGPKDRALAKNSNDDFIPVENDDDCPF